MIEIKNLQKIYRVGEIELEVIKNLNLKIDRGEFISIVGASGSGKSTILNLIGCLDKPNRGEIKIDNIDVIKLSKQEEVEFRAKNIGFIFQDFNLISAYNVFENIEFPLSIILNESDTKSRVEKLLKEIDMESQIDKFPEQLSGGQKQRVAIARALITNPKIVLADEPTANLDSQSAKKVINLMKKMQKEFNTTFIFSTHDRKIVDVAERIITLEDGNIIDDKVQK